jgi:cholinesterase
MYWAAGIVASLALGVTAVPTEWTIGQEVKTSSGSIIGHAAEKRKDVSEYLGVPFAKPPVGELRFAAPVKYEGTGKFNASAYVR